jgi:uncharacterized protein (TIGR03437 family)
MSGEISEYPIPSDYVGCADIAVAADGALWFDCSTASPIGGPASTGVLGRITTAGIMTFFTGGGGSLTAGPDGGLWFSDGNAFGRISLASGIISQFPLPPPPPYAGPGGIALGPDGAFWFTRATEIGRAALTFPTPNIQAVRNGADEDVQTIQAGSWVTIYGYDIGPAHSGNAWGPQDIVNNKLPLSLDGVSVTVNGKPAPVEYVSQTQINVLAPDGIAIGLANIVVDNEDAISVPFTVQVDTYSPAFFTFSPPNERYIAAVFPPGPGGFAVYVAPTGSLGPGVLSRPAMPGEIVELYATGFGPTNPAPPDGQVFVGAYPTGTPVTVTIGGINAVLLWAGLSSPGLYQLNVEVPEGLQSGDAPVAANVGGVQTQDIFAIPVQQ